MLIRTKEAAEILNVAESTLEAWRCRGGGPAFLKLHNKAVRYRQADLDAFMESGIRKNTSETSADRRLTAQ